MTLNCLKRIDSEEELRRMRMNEMHHDDDDDDNNHHKSNFKFWTGRVERNWSGNLTNKINIKPDYKNMRTKSNLGPAFKNHKEAAATPSPPTHHRVTGSGPPSFVLNPESPRLMRSSGMRRDWSFEDLRRTVTN